MGAHTPTLRAGLVVLDAASVGALHRLVLGADAGETLWVDAGGAATTYGLTAAADGLAGVAGPDHALRGIRVARAFTVYQHHELVRRTVRVAGERTDLVVAPRVAALYDEADAPAATADRLYDATVAHLDALGDALDVPVLVTAPGADDERRAALRESATQIVDCEATALGFAFDDGDQRTTAYWHAGWWQTTVPYWVECCGALDAPPDAAARDWRARPTLATATPEL